MDNSLDNLGRSLRNAYTQPNLARVGHMRKDHAWIANQQQHASARFISMLDDAFLISAQTDLQAVTLALNELGDWLTLAESVTYLGEDQGDPVFGVALPQTSSPEIEKQFQHLGEFKDLRSVSRKLPRPDAARLAYAKAMAHWHRTHLFCARCGSQTESQESGHVRVCVNKLCGRHHFPRTDPAVIMLVTDGENLLLGRQKVWREKQYSVLAGFVEPGETAEQAVVREVAEETGVEVTEVHYKSSQPWPFPGSLMLGFHARAEYKPVEQRDDELEHAFWIDRNKLKNDIVSCALRLPPQDSIAYRLIEEWYEQSAAETLDEVLKAVQRQ